ALPWAAAWAAPSCAPSWTPCIRGRPCSWLCNRDLALAELTSDYVTGAVTTTGPAGVTAIRAGDGGRRDAELLRHTPLKARGKPLSEFGAGTAHRLLRVGELV